MTASLDFITLEQQWQSLWETQTAILGWCPSSGQQAQFLRLYRGILAGNQQVNLTRITEPDDFWEKHLWDSVTGLLPWLAETGEMPPMSEESRMIDVGTGGGLPGLVAAIAFPQAAITLLDSTRKKLNALSPIIQSLELKTVDTAIQRAEAQGQSPQHREQYDLALIRAVGSTAVCLEYTLPFLKVGGIAVLYRGQWSETEAQQGSAVAGRLGGRLYRVQAWQTPLTQGQRHCVYLRKEHRTPKAYPRAIGVPAQKPLLE